MTYKLGFAVLQKKAHKYKIIQALISSNLIFYIELDI